ALRRRWSSTLTSRLAESNTSWHTMRYPRRRPMGSVGWRQPPLGADWHCLLGPPGVSVEPRHAGVVAQRLQPGEVRLRDFQWGEELHQSLVRSDLQQRERAERSIPDGRQLQAG